MSNFNWKIDSLHLVERTFRKLLQYKRLSKLKGSVAKDLTLWHIESLELLELIKPATPKIIYDIGANVGTWTLLTKAILPDICIHAFEPLNKHILDFKEKTKGIGDINLHPIALGTKEEILKMQVASFSDASSLLDITESTNIHFQVIKEREEQVQVVRLDDYVEQKNIPLPDVMKLDIQGYELEALKGGLQCLKNSQFIICEVSFIEFYKGQPLFFEVIQFMKTNSFDVYAMGVNTPLGKEISQIDILFKRNT